MAQLTPVAGTKPAPRSVEGARAGSDVVACQMRLRRAGWRLTDAECTTANGCIIWVATAAHDVAELRVWAAGPSVLAAWRGAVAQAEDLELLGGSAQASRAGCRAARAAAASV